MRADDEGGNPSRAECAVGPTVIRVSAFVLRGARQPTSPFLTAYWMISAVDCSPIFSRMRVR